MEIHGRIKTENNVELNMKMYDVMSQTLVHNIRVYEL